jgi:hypothetical protein
MNHTFRPAIAMCLGLATASLLCPDTSAAADDIVTYEIFSGNVGIAANVEYVDSQRRILIENVSLPWRMDTAVAGGPDRSEVRADWRPDTREKPNKWVTVRILHNGKILCQSTLDIGNATCYGNTPHIA